MDRAAILWVLLLILGLLFGLVVLVTAFGVARHLRRPRPPSRPSRRRAARDFDDENEADPSGGWRRNHETDDDQGA